MCKSKIVWKLLCLVLLLGSMTCTKAVIDQGDDLILEDDKTINVKFSQMQVESDKFADECELDPAKCWKTDDLNDSFRIAAYDSIVEKGEFTDQIDIYKQQSQIVETDFKGKAMEIKSGQSFMQLKELIPQMDNPAYLLDAGFTKNVYKLPLSGQTKKSPWSASYYPMKNGGTSVRYAMNEKNTIGVVNPGTGRYTAYYSYYQSVNKYRQPQEHNAYYRSAGYSNYVNRNYSATEKYDLVMGDYAFTLTNYAKTEPLSYMKNGQIPGWYGYCDGWSSASYVFRKAIRAYTVRSPGGVAVRFLPSDVHGLAVQFMAKASYKTKWIGARCNGNPNHVSCRALNPGSFVIAIGNHIGLQGKNMVCDPLSDTEIWNHPAKAYSMRYYNVLNNSFTSNASAARATATNVRYCRSAWCRRISSTMSSSAAYIVGVYIRWTYATESNPVHSTGALPDKFKTDSFDGYLELDSSGNILGGGWKNSAVHPNFCWTPDLNKPIEGISDSVVTSYPFSNIAQYARQASKKGQVLKAFLNWIVSKTS